MGARTSAEWIEHFAANRRHWDDFDFDRDPGVTLESLRPILQSIQAWQLGETSEGHHMRAAARRHADAIGDADFPAAVDGFILEEQTHGEALGKFLDQVGAKRIRRHWADSIFRAIRYTWGIELWTTIVIMVETMALQFYSALRNATPSHLLRDICAQMLRDEGPHLRFQYERLALIHARRRPWLLRLTYLGQRLLFTTVVVGVWLDSRKLLRAGGFTFASYWSQAWRKMNYHWQQMRPEVPAVALSKVPETARRETPSRVGGWLH